MVHQRRYEHRPLPKKQHGLALVGLKLAVQANIERIVELPGQITAEATERRKVVRTIKRKRSRKGESWYQQHKTEWKAHRDEERRLRELLQAAPLRIEEFMQLLREQIDRTSEAGYESLAAHFAMRFQQLCSDIERTLAQETVPVAALPAETPEKQYVADLVCGIRVALGKALVTVQQILADVQTIGRSKPGMTPGVV